ncbi:hypothetical protein, partial [Faecalibaculum rodentium]|uniref:hypothetical protein n=1 Tax=Faecalibaculum rodentium TaxID=1702221 RepID=UPI0026F3C832
MNHLRQPERFPYARCTGICRIAGTRIAASPSDRLPQPVADSKKLPHRQHREDVPVRQSSVFIAEDGSIRSSHFCPVRDS